MPALPRAFLDRPIAHRALHDLQHRRPENSVPAIRAALSARYGIEIDLQLSSDGRAMVFHDYDLGRLTGQTGTVRQTTSGELQRIELLHGGGPIPSLRDVLGLVAGRVPLLIELKDQDGALGPRVGALEEAAIRDLDGYSGPVALMSFNPHSVAQLARLAPNLPRGLTTCAFDPDEWPSVPKPRCAELRMIPDIEQVSASFISHDRQDLHSTRVAELRARFPVLCWTIKSAAQETAARQFADNVTFEGYEA